MSSLARELSELSVSAPRQEFKYELPAPTREAALYQIECHRTAILRLSTQLNTFAPPARLPDELLCEIFRYYAVAKTQRPRASPYAFIEITHVCRYWRNVALNFHPFWRQIQIMDDAKYAPCIEEMLIRSKKAPLTVTANIHLSAKSVSLKVFKLVAAQIHRVQFLDLTIPSVNFSGIAKFFGKKNATETLKYLRLVHYRNSRSGTKATSLEFPPCLLPRLEKLDTTDFSLDTIAPFAKATVRSFIFKDSRTWGNQNHVTSVDDLLGVIQKMPLLTTLWISSENLVSQTPKSRSQPIQLNNLESLKLSGFDVDQLTDFMSNVHFPVTTKLAITIYTQPPSPNRYTAVPISLPLASLLQKRLGGDQDDIGFQSAFLHCSTPPSLQAWRDASEMTGPDSVGPDFLLTVPNRTSVRSISQFCHNFTPLIHVHTFEMKSFQQGNLDSSSFGAFLSTLPNLKNLTLSSLTEYDVVVLLSAAFISRQLLSLDILFLNDIAFGEPKPYWDSAADFVVDVSSEYCKKGRFLDAHLARRREIGDPLTIGKLIIRKARYLNDSKRVEELRPFVDNGNVDWDGRR